MQTMYCMYIYLFEFFIWLISYRMWPTQITPIHVCLSLSQWNDQIEALVWSYSSMIIGSGALSYYTQITDDYSILLYNILSAWSFA